MIFYLGKKNIRACSSCLTTFSKQVEAYIMKSDAYWLTGYDYKVICNICAKREMFKHPKRWKAIQEKIVILPKELDIV